MKVIKYLTLRFGLFVFFALVTSPILIASVFLLDHIDALKHGPLAKWLFIPVFLTWLIGNPWLAGQAARRMAFEELTFGVAVKLTFYDLWLRLSFLPLVGHWFEPHIDKRDTDEDDG